MSSHAISSTHHPPYLRLALLLIAAWALLIVRLSAPWYGVQDAHQMWVAAGARNYERFGLDKIGVALVINPAPSPDDEPHYYHHHPPLIIWLPALLSTVTGENETSVKFVFAAAILISVAAMYTLGRRLFGEKAAWWAALFYAFVPFIAYYGRVPGHDQLAMPIIVLFTIVFYDWLRTPTQGRFVALLALIVLSVWSAWSAIFMVAAFGVVGMLVATTKQRIRIVMMGAFTLANLAAMILLYQWMWDGTIHDLIDIFIYRTSSAEGREGSASINMLQWGTRILLQTVLMLTPGVMAMALVGLAILRRYVNRQSAVVIAALFLGGITYQLVFRNASYIHDYYKIILVPAFALCAGLAWVIVRQQGRFGKRLRPAFDVLFITFLIPSAIVFYIWHWHGNQPLIDTIIQWMHANDTAASTVAVYVNPDDYLTGSENNNVIEYYTGHPVLWDVTLDDALEMSAETPTLYIYCGNVQPTELAQFPSEMLYANFCTLYHLNSG